MDSFTYTGDWNVAKGKLKQRYPQLTDEDLEFEPGSETRLLDQIHRRLGGDRMAVQRGVSQLLGTSS